MSARTNTSSTGGGSSYPSINIIGAGIAGLSLACHLRRRRIPFNIFDSASRPKGHNYGITISPWGYSDLLPALEPRTDLKRFHELTAVDRLVGGAGNTTSFDQDSHCLRVSDMALREVLARGHQVHWNHTVVSTESLAQGLRLEFENGKASTAAITIDAGGERSGLSSLMLPDLKPEILSYAVYHGSRYIPQSKFTSQHNDIFLNGDNVRSFPPSSTSQPWHLQLAKTNITHTDLPSKVTLDPGPDEPIIELRYTFSRPALSSFSSSSSSDPLFNPSRAKNEASKIPPAFFDAVSKYLAASDSNSNPNSSSSLPRSVSALLDPETLRHDRILNWLMRVKPVERERLAGLSSKCVISIGDAVHSTPPVCSKGADYAMADAEAVAAWIEDNCSTGDVSEGQIMQFYENIVDAWRGIGEEAEMALKEVHGVQ